MLVEQRKDNRILFSVEDRRKFEQDKKKRNLEVIEQRQRERVKKRAASLPNKPVLVASLDSFNVFSNNRERNEPLLLLRRCPLFQFFWYGN